MKATAHIKHALSAPAIALSVLGMLTSGGAMSADSSASLVLAAANVEHEVVDMTIARSETLKVGREIVIHSGVLFEPGSAELSDEGKLVLLERFEKYGHKDNRMAINCVGHADSTEGEAQALSQKRAQVVASYIREKKHSLLTQVDASGAGFAEPVANNGSTLGRALNRRVVVTAVGTVGPEPVFTE